MYGENIEKLKLKGTTTLALKCVDGVILATDTRASMLPSFIAHKKVKKSYQITPYIGMTMAGSPADAVNLLDMLKANSSLYEIERKRIISVKSVTNLASNMLFSNRYYPYAVQIIIGGYDLDGYHIYSLDPFGSAIEDNVVATGSGSPVAYGILESDYKEDMNLEKGLPLAFKAIHSAIKRDVFTGDNIDLVKITKEKGYVELTEEEKNKFKEKTSK